MRFRSAMPACLLGPAFLLAALMGLGDRARAADDHAAAVAGLADLRAAIGEIVQAENSYATDKAVYRTQAQRAINALVGARGTYYKAQAGTSGDAEGALGHIDRLLDRRESPVWAVPLHGAEANIRAAVAHLLDGLVARELMDFQISASRALSYLEVAVGRPSSAGVFGGMEGALATTVLGVPAGAPQQDACGPVLSAPSYGTHGGYIAYLALPATAGVHALAEPTGITEVKVQGGTVILPTAAAGDVAKLCGGAVQPAADTQAAPGPAGAQEGAASTTAPSPTAPPATESGAASATTQEGAASATTQGTATGAGGSRPSSAPPALYTMAQAKAGKKIFEAKCVSCHGANLQGTAAPSVAGKDFLDTAQRDGWTLKVIRYIVFDLMPRNSPGALPPEQSADVMAYLLASNCYPAGSTAFPTQDEPSFADLKMGPVPGAHPGENKLGVCPVP